MITLISVAIPWRNNMKKHDHRLDPRFTTNDSGAVMVFQNLILSHNLLDVSKKGLAFSYSIGFGHANWIGEELDIDIHGEDFVIVDVPVRIISDNPFGYIEMDEPFNEGKCDLRRCSVQFSPLNPRQKKQIESYIESLDILSSLEN
jgi:hypothetical protein